MIDFQDITAIDYLQSLYRGCDDGHIVFVNTKPGTEYKQVPAYFHVTEIPQAAEFVDSYTGTDLYMKVNVMDHDKTIARSKFAVGGCAEVKAVVSFHLDVDAGKSEKYLTPDRIIDILDNKMPLQPSGIVQTNGDAGGFHAYWLLAEPFYITSEEDRKRCQTISANWLAELRYHAKPGTIDGTANLDRVLRPVGSLRKSGNRVRHLIWNDSRRFKLEDFQVPDRSPPKPTYQPTRELDDDQKPIEKYLVSNRLDSVEAILQSQHYEDVGRGFWRRPRSESGAPTGEIYHKDGKQGFTVKSGAADPLNCENGSGATGNWYSIPALWVSFHTGADVSNQRNPQAWKQAAEFCKKWLDDQKPKPDTSRIEQQAEASSTNQQADDMRGPELFSFSQLVARYPKKREPIIDGLLRVGETMNVIGASKAGKSWLITGLLLSVATGRKWLGHEVNRQKVLLIDNELHHEELTSRISRVVHDMKIDPEADQLDDWFTVMPLRGRLLDITGIQGVLSNVRQNDYRVIALDAFYRVLPAGMSENDNAAMADIYNRLDAIAGELDCSVILNHHSSKGDQSGKAVTDVGSGAGSISRAADSHLIIRPHELEGCAVLEGVCRSFPPPEPRTIRWEWPLWYGSEIEPEIKKPKTRGQATQQQNDEEADRKILEVVRTNPRRTSTQIRRKSGMGQTRVDRALVRLEEAGLLVSKRKRRKGTKQGFEVYEAVQQEVSYD